MNFGNLDLPGLIVGEDDDDVQAPQASTNPNINQAVVNELIAHIRRKARDQFRDLLRQIARPELHLDCGDCDAQRNTVMHLVVLSCDDELISAALEAGGSVNLYENADGETPLTMAVSIYPHAFLTMLRDAKQPKAKRVSSKGQNLLHAVVTAKATSRPWPQRLTVVRELIEKYQVPTKQVDDNGFTPAEWAREHFLGLGNDAAEIVALLSRKQSKLPGASDFEFSSFYRAPYTRLVTVCLLAVLHCLQYGADTWDRPTYTQQDVPVVYQTFFGNHSSRLYSRNTSLDLAALNATSTNQSYFTKGSVSESVQNPLPLGSFPFVFVALNMVASQWRAPTNIIAAHLGCMLLGTAVGVTVALLIREFLFKTLFGLRLFGADSDRPVREGSERNSEEASAIASVIGGTDADGTPPAASHGTFFCVFAGTLCGLYCGALLLNYFLEHRFHGAAAYVIRTTVSDRSSVEVMRGCWVLSLLFDAFVFFLVLDTMLQQAAANVMLPDPNFSSFGRPLHQNLPAWRLIWWLGLVPFTWLTILITFGVRAQKSGITMLYTPGVKTSSPGQALVLPALSILFDAIIVQQDWQLPVRRCTPELLVPWLPARSNCLWLMWFLFSILLAMDFRLLVGQISVFVSTVDVSSSTRRFEMAMALLPAFVGVLLFVVCFLRTSTKLSARRGQYADDESRSQQLPSAGKGAKDVQHVPLGRKAAQQLQQQQQQRTRLGGDAPAPPATMPGLLDSQSPIRPAISRPLQQANSSPMPLKRLAVREKQVGPEPARPNSSSGKRAVVNDIWTAAAADDVVKLCTMLEQDPTLINQRGGPGIECDATARTVVVMTPQARAGAEYAATPIHYAIASGARSTMAALISRGANVRLRTAHGMYSCAELAEMIGTPELREQFCATSAAPTPTLERKQSSVASPRKPA